MKREEERNIGMKRQLRAMEKFQYFLTLWSGRSMHAERYQMAEKSAYNSTLKHGASVTAHFITHPSLDR